jgi:hypothetical protein
MEVILKRTLWFALAVFLLDLALEAITFEMPFSHEWGVWKGELLLHLVAVVTVSICASAGGFIGFYLFPKARVLRVKQLFWVGAAFVAVVFVVDGLLTAGGLIWRLPGLTVFAFIVVQSVGRWVAAPDAQP